MLMCILPYGYGKVARHQAACYGLYKGLSSISGYQHNRRLINRQLRLKHLLMLLGLYLLADPPSLHITNYKNKYPHPGKKEPRKQLFPANVW